MRNLLLTISLHLLTLSQAFTQPLSVPGSAGTTGNFTTQFEGNYFTVLRNDGYAVVGLDGKTVAGGIKAPSNGFFRTLSLYHGTLFADEAGSIVLKKVNGQDLGTGKYMQFLPFTTDNTVVRLPSAQGVWIVAYIDTAGKEIVRFDVRKYLAIAQPLNKSGGFTFLDLSEFLPFSEGLTPIKSRLTGKYGYIDTKLQLILPVGYSDARPFSDGLAAVRNADGIWGFINRSGKLVIPYTYSRTPSRFMYGRARVQSQDGRFGYINKENVVVIQPKYQTATCFYKGYALVREAWTQPISLIDSSGAVVASFPKDLIYVDNAGPGPGISGTEQPEYPFYISETLKQLVDEGKGIFQKGMNYGLMDKTGKTALDFQYGWLSGFHDGKMFAHYSAFINNRTVNKDGIIDDQGNWLIQISPSQF
jgi:hypothetical protein